MPLTFGPNIVEGKVYRSKKRRDGDDEREALRELQTILAIKNRKACDCEAQIHDLMENCLACGRLACVVEGPGKCFSCGGIVLSHDQRERLKQHVDILHTYPPNCDMGTKQGSIAKTRIIDDQFDLFAIDDKKHLREEDRRKLRENLEELQSQRYQRKLMLDVDISNLEAGSKSTPQIDDYEAALRKLQLDSQQPAVDSDLSLTELVQQEAKKSYMFQYVGESVLKKKQKQQKEPSHSEGVTVNISQSVQMQKQKQMKTSQGLLSSNLQSRNKSRKRNTGKLPPPRSNAWGNKNIDKSSK